MDNERVNDGQSEAHGAAQEPCLNSATVQRAATTDDLMNAQHEENRSNVDSESKSVTDSNNNKRSEVDASNDNSIDKDEPLVFPTPCPSCHQPAQTNVHSKDIPHFKQVIFMCLLCEHCGFKSNEIKSGGSISKFCTKMTLRVCSQDDMTREVVKSETAGIAIPELDFELEAGGLGGVFTTVEGLLKKLCERLESVRPFATSHMQRQSTNDGSNDVSTRSQSQVSYGEFIQKMNDYAGGRALPFTLVISDPLSNSFVGPVVGNTLKSSLQAKPESTTSGCNVFVDEGLDIQQYERSRDENESLGLNDIKTECYHESDTRKSS